MTKKKVGKLSKGMAHYRRRKLSEIRKHATNDVERIEEEKKLENELEVYRAKHTA